MKTVLTIAGSDSSGGAGIQADIKTITMNGAYAMSAITALTAQNTLGVVSVLESTPLLLKQQIDTIFEDIYPDAVKVGMISSAKLIEVVAERLAFYDAKNIVVDPVMVATSGSALIQSDAIIALQKQLFPIAQIVTPNIPEAEVLTGIHIRESEDMIAAAKLIENTYGCAVLIKGGHNSNDANDLLFFNGEEHWFKSRRINTQNTHGTGCTLSSAIAANLAKGCGLVESIKYAKDYLTEALSAGLDLGHGAGPIAHNFALIQEV